jgi:hypothetical protein
MARRISKVRAGGSANSPVHGIQSVLNFKEPIITRENNGATIVPFMITSMEATRIF